MNGGSTVLGYEVQIDDGNTGEFRTVMGSTLDHPDQMSLETKVLVSGLTKGLVYRVRYRATNTIGAGQWSDIAFMRAAQVPIPPPSPYVSFVDNSRIDL